MLLQLTLQLTPALAEPGNGPASRSTVSTLSVFFDSRSRLIYLIYLRLPPRPPRYSNSSM